MPINEPNSSVSVLDLLAATLRLEYGQSEALCYGLGPATDSIPQMQKGLLTLVTAEIRACTSVGARVYLQGQSLDTIAETLANDGIDVCSVATHALESDSFDAIVIEGSVLYLDQLEVLSAARCALKTGGQLVLLGENLADDSKIEKSDLANLSSLLQLGERLGFELIKRQDLTTDAGESLGRFMQLVTANRNELARLLNLSAESWQKLLEQLQLMADEFASGRRCFGVFRFCKLANPPGEYATAEYGDINSFEPEEIRSLFEASFGVEFDAELWHWKYELGAGTCVVAREKQGGAIVSHYGGAPRKIDYFGKPSMAIQPCDVMVLPEVRRHYGKSSLFFKTAATFLEREIGNTVNHLLGFGFPNQKAMNIALRLGLYKKTDDFVEVVFPVANGNSEKITGESLAIEDPQHRQLVDTMWQAMRAEFAQGIIGVRDADYIRYRYFDHPFAHRGLLERVLLRDRLSNEPLAILFFRPHEQQTLLMDILCPPAKLTQMLGLASAYVAAREGPERMKMWITKGYLDRVQSAGCTVNELGIEIPCNSWNPGPDAEILYGAWWLTAGDMDFI